MPNIVQDRLDAQKKEADRKAQAKLQKVMDELDPPASAPKTRYANPSQATKDSAIFRNLSLALPDPGQSQTQPAHSQTLLAVTFTAPKNSAGTLARDPMSNGADAAAWNTVSLAATGVATAAQMAHKPVLATIATGVAKVAAAKAKAAAKPT